MTGGGEAPHPLAHKVKKDSFILQFYFKQNVVSDSSLWGGWLALEGITVNPFVGSKNHGASATRISLITCPPHRSGTSKSVSKKPSKVVWSKEEALLYRETFHSKVTTQLVPFGGSVAAQSARINKKTAALAFSSTPLVS